jgi:hypothetical protein
MYLNNYFFMKVYKVATYRTRKCLNRGNEIRSHRSRLEKEPDIPLLVTFLRRSGIPPGNLGQEIILPCFEFV